MRIAGQDVEFSGVSYDSRETRPGDLFVALVGATADGHDFVRDAYDRGARAFLVERPVDLPGDATVVAVPDTLVALAPIAREFFGDPAEQVKVIALTGTKGKTSISFMLKAVFEAAGRSAGLIGSNGIFYRDARTGEDVWFKTHNTTPDAWVLNRTLREMADAGVEFVVLEATSQGFFRHRTDGIRFAVGAFTNLAEDHISATEHPSFEHYLASKQRIFDQTDVVFVNRDDPSFERIVAGAKAEVRTFGQSPDALYRASDVALAMGDNLMTVEFTATTPGWTRDVLTHIPGTFTVSNALTALCVADFLGIEPDAVVAGLAAARVKGRMELVPVPAPYTVVIDFAHNRLSAEAMMETARAYHPHRILTVFGLEGERAHVRRFDCGEVIGRSADVIVLADASPRRDDPDRILADIAEGVARVGGTSRTIRDRATAIRTILDEAEPGDLILLVGKGDVPYEEVMGVDHPFNEREVVRDYFLARGDG